jgi:hypothetical protein
VFETGDILRGKKKMTPLFNCYSKDNGAFDSYRTLDVLRTSLLLLVFMLCRAFIKMNGYGKEGAAE